MTQGRKPRPASRNVRGKVILEMIKQGKFGSCVPVYDWNDLIYCSKEFPIGNSKDGTKLEVCIFSISFIYILIPRKKKILFN